MKAKLRELENSHKEMQTIQQKVTRLAKAKKSGPTDETAIRVTEQQLQLQEKHKPNQKKWQDNLEPMILELRGANREEAADKLQKALEQVIADDKAVNEKYQILVERRKELLAQGGKASTSSQSKAKQEAGSRVAQSEVSNQRNEGGAKTGSGRRRVSGKKRT